ncbi:MAG: hypothetical protein AB1486_30715 [Planctomycetota bacterium]
MRWRLSKPAPKPESEQMQAADIEESLRRSVLFTRLQDLVAWGRKNSIWPAGACDERRDCHPLDIAGNDQRPAAPSERRCRAPLHDAL